MRILGLDTATGATAVALLDTADGSALEARDDPEPGVRPRHTTRLMALVVELLKNAGLGWDGVDRIAVGLGPGTFTGLRIGVATARALAQATSIPLVGVSTLQSLALGAAPDARRAGIDVVTAVLDARRGEVFAAAWPADRADGADGADGTSWSPLLLPRAASPQTLATQLQGVGSSRLAVGDGALAFAGVLERPGTRIPEGSSRLHRVSAINHCRLAALEAPRSPAEIRPDYLRLPDAELALRDAERS